MADHNSIIGAELELVGTLVSSGDLSIDGNVKGDIRAKGHVTISPGGKVVGNLYAEQITVRGNIEGGVFAKAVQLGSTCRLKGDIVHARLSMEEGAIFDGNCRHSDNPVPAAPETMPSSSAQA